jgi:hypothetical protein
MASTCKRCGKDLGKDYPGNVYCCRQQKSDAVELINTNRQADHWLLLHNYPLVLVSWNAATCEAWYRDWERRIPNINCDCRRHWKELVEANPPDFASPLAFFQWGVDRHNDVNRRLGKPEVSFDEACRLYGWP